MALRCDNCGKGREVGHNVSHAKNRTFRLFKPNLQKLRVLQDGISVRVKFCTSCIQRLKRDKRLGEYMQMIYAKPALQVAVPVTLPSKKNIDRESKKIEEIMQKEVTRKQESEEKEKTKAKEKIKIEELVGKK
ncbi:50S ribosomal protein L28 [Candidatus Gottesmanbacteria bacterium RIFCSPHIGHO2_01_FULL_39_10]|uniref:Large ribosomal subunit protein bL28 n=1 Tax=Candidatus Gottesmanbacteria bacterium RIFCSPHIGHO2_01_FULL_39_10 TaxID=1798375 RepID=A0A1F5ZPH0_9BACT|nr:MAG: 50S ribosomal protein L28 [Candidatus Gottesmanbacteria bacterium RIFCSPHIGHO2_01_FULL_39_10]